MIASSNNFIKATIGLFLFIAFSANAQWTVNPNEQKCFIENKGQFYNKVKSGDVAFGINNIGYQLYFLKDRFVLRYDEITTVVNEENEGEKEEKEEIRTKIKTTLVEYIWQNTNKDVSITAEDCLPNVYNYAEKIESKSVYNCKAYKKLIYKNLYAGIDV